MASFCHPGRGHPSSGRSQAFILPYIFVIIFSDVLLGTVQPAGCGLMPRRRRSRYAFYRRLRLLRETQHRGKVRRSILLTLVVIFAIPLMAVPAIAAESVGDLPAIDGLSSSGLHQDMLIFDRHGTLIDDIGDHGDHRIVVPLSNMSPFVRQASIAIEDKTFYKNNGVDLAGIARAAIEKYSHHRITPGGRTISQQLVKQ